MRCERPGDSLPVMYLLPLHHEDVRLACLFEARMDEGPAGEQGHCGYAAAERGVLVVPVRLQRRLHGDAICLQIDNANLHRARERDFGAKVSLEFFGFHGAGYPLGSRFKSLSCPQRINESCG